MATAGIVGLVDEATGFQEERDKDELANILAEFVAKEIRAWVPTFDTDFYKMIFKLRDWAWTGTTKRPQIVGKITNNLVYDRLAPGLLAELQRVNPKNEKGNRKGKLFQHLTDHRGYPGLIKHLAKITGWGDMCESWDQFMKVVNDRAPVYEGRTLFDEEFRDGST